MKRFIYLTDTHGQLVDHTTLTNACQFAQWFKPDLLVHGGDNWDLRCLRSGASDEDQAFPLKDDLECAENTLDKFFGSYYKAYKVFLFGNHDLPRVEKLMKSPRTVIAEFAENLRDDMIAAVTRFTNEYRMYNKGKGVYTVEGFNFIHGFAAGVHAVRKHAISYRHSMSGHVHRFSSHTLEDLEQSTSYTVASCCQNDQEYNAAHLGTLGQENGFAYGFLDGERRIYDIHFARKHSDGTFYLPTEWTTK